MRTVQIAALVGSFVTMSEVVAADIGPHDRFLRENYNVSEAKKYRSDSDWWISCFFVDLNQDGFEDVISTTVSQADRYGDACSVWTTKPDGGLYLVGEEALAAQNFVFTSYYYSFYLFDHGNGHRNVIGLDLSAGFADGDRKMIKTPTPDCVFGISSENQLSVEKMSPCLDDAFYSCMSGRVERLYAEGFCGFGFKPVQRTEWFGYKFPIKEAVKVRDSGLPEFLSEYRKEAQLRIGNTNSVSVYSVSLDANNDGYADCYVTTSADKNGADSYRWSLFMNTDGRFRKSVGIVRPVHDRADLPGLEPEVTARKDAFCRVVRFDAPPSYIVLDDSKVKGELVKKTITNLRTHSVEKLRCDEFSAAASSGVSSM